MATTVLITGATSGIGRAAALRLAARGHLVLATGRNDQRLAELAAEAHAAGLGERLSTWPLDVTSEDSIAAARTEFERWSGTSAPDALVNNAGYSAPGPLELVDDAQLREQFDTNVFGLMTVTRAFAAQMRQRGSGRIVNVSSIMGRMTLPLHGPYNASKYAVEALTDALRMELAPFGVKVVAIEPGNIRSAFEHTALAGFARYRDSDSPYDDAVAGINEVYARAYRRSPGPDRPALLIQRAIEDRRPRARYITTPSRLQLALFRALPTPAADALKRRATGLRPSPTSAGPGG